MNPSNSKSPSHEQQLAVSLIQQLQALKAPSQSQVETSEIDEAFDDLNFTLQQVQLCSDKPERCAAELRALCDELETDTRALEEIAPDPAVRSQQVKDTLKQARRTQRILNREAISMDSAAATAHTSPSSPSPASPSPKQSLKINRVKLPSFDGDAVKYQHFRNAFRENIENNTELTDTTRWIHLRESLTGTAAELISEIPETSKDLQSALNLLDATYGHSKRITLHLFQKIYQLPAATTDITQLRLTQAKLEGLLSSLENTGHPVSTDPHLHLIATNKFPVEMIHQVTQGRELSFAELRSQLHTFITARENISAHILQTTPTTPTTSASAKPTPNISRNTQRTTRAVNQKPITCVFCKGPHWSDACPTYTTAEARAKQLTDRCLRCFRQKHDGPCGSERRCVYCDSIDHNRSLCPKKFGAIPKPPQTSLYAAQHNTGTETDGVFWTLKVLVSSPITKEPIEVRAVIDSGGAKTIISKRLAHKLCLKPANEHHPIQMQSLGATSLPPAIRATPNIYLHPPARPVISVPTHITSTIADDLPAASVEQFRKLYPQHNNVTIPDTGAGDSVELLFGKDTLLSILTLEKSISVSTTHQLLATAFGHIIVTNESENKPKTVVTQLSFDTTNDLKQMWELDTLGLTFVESEEVENEAQALKKFYATIEFKEGRYHVGLLYTHKPPLLDEGFGLAWGWLTSLWAKLKHHPKLLQEYDAIIKEQLQQNIIEATSRRSLDPQAIIHYIPHHPILRPDSASTKLRIVYDASAGATQNKKSLNQNLHKGLSWVEEIFAILLRFRRFSTAVTADIAKAFLQIGIQEPFRDAVRFLWLRDITQPPSPENIIIFRFTRIAFGIISSPFLLHATISHHLRTTNHPLTEKILTDLYADNLVAALDSQMPVADYYRDIKIVFNEMAMNMTKWVTNSPVLRELFHENDRIKEIRQPVLGLLWHTHEDTLSFKPIDFNLAQLTTLTKRQALSDMARVYDPFGWATPLLLPAKLFLRRLWEAQNKWDEHLSNELIEEWKTILHELQNINRIIVPRALQKSNTLPTLQIHTFVDASAVACAVVIYLRVLHSTSTHTSILAAKSRLTPKKPLSIPRLELLAAVLGTRFTRYVDSKLQWLTPTSNFFWTDSKLVLGWLTSSKILPAAITKQITEIKAHKYAAMNYVPSQLNQA